MNFSLNQLVKASLLALVLVTPIAFSTPEVQAVPAPAHKQIALATATKKHRYHHAKKVRHHNKAARGKM